MALPRCAKWHGPGAPGGLRGCLGIVRGVAEHPLHVVAVTGYVRDDSGRVLLARVQGRGWEMPGGQVEEGEDLFSAVAREVMEETSCVVAAERLVGIYSKLSPAPSMTLHLFACRYLSGEPAARETEVPEVGWFRAESARDMVTQPPSAQRLSDALADAGRPFYRVYRSHPYAAIAEWRV